MVIFTKTKTKTKNVRECSQKQKKTLKKCIDYLIISDGNEYIV